MKSCIIAITLLAATVVQCSPSISVPPSALLAIRNVGLQTVQQIAKTLNEALTQAVDEFVPVNITCEQQVSSFTTSCSSCATSKCEARAKKECEPSKLEKVLGEVIEFGEDAGKFVLRKVPHFIIKDLPNKIIDITKDIGGFLKDKVLDKVIDVHKKIGQGAIDVTKGLGKGVLKLGEKTIKEIGRVGEKIGDFGKSAIKEVGRVGERVGKEVGRFFRRIFGKRSLRGIHAIRARRSAEPSCKDFENNGGQACQVYKTSAFCPACSFDVTKDCPGYTAALRKIQEKQNDREWLVRSTNSNFNLLSMTFSMGPTGNFMNVQASVDMFGKTLRVNLGSVNPYVTAESGRVLALRAIDAYKVAN